MVGIISSNTQINTFSQNNAKLVGSIGLNKSSIGSSNTDGVNDSVKSESNLKNNASAYLTKYSNNSGSTNNINGVKVASLDSVEISSESRQLFAATSSNSLLDIAKKVVDIATDFLPGVGTAKDVYNLYQTIVDPSSTTKDIAWAVADLVPGPSLTKLKKFANVIIDKFNLNSSTAKKLNDSLTQTAAKKIKDMDILDTQTFIRKSEATSVGHAKEKHLDVSDLDLKLRSKAERVPATKFTNGAIMKEYINYSMKKNADKIANWLNSSSTASLELSEPSSKVLGHGFEYKSATQSYTEYKNIQKGIIVLKKDSSNEYGFNLVTAYPVAK